MNLSTNAVGLPEVDPAFDTVAVVGVMGECIMDFDIRRTGAGMTTVGRLP